MTLQEFATRYSLKVKKDSCGDEIIPGRDTVKSKPDRLENHHHIWEGDGKFFIFLTFPTKARWTSAHRRLENLDLTTRQSFENEGVMGFNPEDELQVLPLLKFAGIRVKRRMTPEQLEALRTRLAKRTPRV